MSGMDIGSPNMPNIEDGFHSALLAKERVKLIDGLNHGHPELHLDYAFMGRETEDRASPIVVGKFSKDRWLITHPAVQRYSASMDHWKTRERCDHEWCANPGGEVRSGGVDC